MIPTPHEPALATNAIYSGVTVPISQELLEDAPDLFGIIKGQMQAVVNDQYFMDIYAHGLRPWNRNFMPEFVPFPLLQRTEQRLKAAERKVRRTFGRFSDAISAFKHGIPEPDDDW